MIAIQLWLRLLLLSAGLRAMMSLREGLYQNSNGSLQFRLAFGQYVGSDNINSHSSTNIKRGVAFGSTSLLFVTPDATMRVLSYRVRNTSTYIGLRNLVDQDSVDSIVSLKVDWYPYGTITLSMHHSESETQSEHESADNLLHDLSEEEDENNDR